MSYVVIAKTRDGKRLQVGRAYESRQAAIDLCDLVRKRYSGAQVFCRVRTGPQQGARAAARPLRPALLRAACDEPTRPDRGPLAEHRALHRTAIVNAARFGT
jgi:hypothetical protein